MNFDGLNSKKKKYKKKYEGMKIWKKLCNKIQFYINIFRPLNVIASCIQSSENYIYESITKCIPTEIFTLPTIHIASLLS